MSNQKTGTTPSAETRAAEEAEAQASHRADRPPTAGEQASAPTSPSSQTEESFEEMARKGANVKGEGEVP